ncbi:MAG: hypothetical protein A2X84_04350 [Desulfuromonadaceae bacterium GWC2_58_13]|nr:MAG: hypothetical protein A2X84_04350 [Desulfuromonadaceae bacterium GWC2_58_13]
MEHVIRFVVGGAMIVVICLLGKSKYPQLAGLAVLFPAVTLVGYYFLISEQGKDAVRTMIGYSLLGLPTVLVFLLCLYFALGKFDIFTSFSIAIGAWLLTAVLIYWNADRVFRIVGG